MVPARPRRLSGRKVPAPAAAAAAAKMREGALLHSGGTNCTKARREVWRVRGRFFYEKHLKIL